MSRAPQLRSAAGSDRVDDRIGRSLAQLLGHLVVPTATYNAAETADRQRLARHQIPVVVQNIARGEVLVRRGQEVTPDHVLLFKQINQQGASQHGWSPSEQVCSSLYLSLAYTGLRYDTWLDIDPMLEILRLWR